MSGGSVAQVAQEAELAGQCARCLRLDVQLLAAHHLHELAVSSHLCEEEDVKEMHPAIGALARWVAGILLFGRGGGGAGRCAGRCCGARGGGCEVLPPLASHHVTRHIHTPQPTTTQPQPR